MIKRLIFTSAVYLYACTPPAPTALAPVADLTSGPLNGAAVSTASRATYGRWGFDTAGMDGRVPPGESFHRFASGLWLERTQIPADKSNYGLFTALSDLSDARTRALIESSAGQPGSDERKIADLYRTFLDEAAIEALGAEPLRERVGAIAAASSRERIVSLLAELSTELETNPLRTYVSQDERAPDQHIANLAQGGLGLPDRDLYDANNGQFAPVREGYVRYITRLFELIGMPNPAARAAAVYALEEKLAASHWTRVENRDPQKTYNKLSVPELVKLAPAIPWDQWFAATGLTGQTHVNVNQPTAIAAVSTLLEREPIDVWRDYITLRVVSSAAPYLPNVFVDTWFEMYGKTLSGTPALKPRWQRGVDLVTDSLGEAVGKLYVARHFTPETKAEADRLVANLLRAMDQRLDSLTWMGDETKAQAKRKLSTYNPKIGYPKRWRDYSALEIRPGDAVGNARRAAQFEYRRLLAKLGQPVDRDEWGMTPMTVNAYYNPTLNEIVFPAAILQPPFFDPHADPAINYGGIGAVIGHEISHGFDDSGAQYDESGALRNWWTPTDLEKFKAQTQALVAQYSTYCPFPAQAGKPAQCVNGQLTLGENIADLAGLTIAFAAYQISLKGNPAPVLDGYTGEQRFFLGWAQVWRRLYRDQELAQRLVTDPHSPSEFRVAVVRNLDQWYQAFSPTPTDRLFLPKEQRVRLW